jgi:NitT/TauT family transport system permease protein
MEEQPPPVSPSTVPASPAQPAPQETPPRLSGGSFALRKPIPLWQTLLLAAGSLATVAALWWLLTRGPVEERIVGPYALPSPYETFSRFRSLWFDSALARNTLATLQRLSLGFLAAICAGLPLGIAAGCFPRFGAMVAPLVMFGRNIPIAALIPLLLFLVPHDGYRQIVFIFVASVAFILADVSQAIRDVAERYVDTAYTLGASRWQTMMKVLVPLAMPSVFNSWRLLFGLAFGYIMLAESIKESTGIGGLGFMINTFQRRNDKPSIYLVLLIIPLIALSIDQLLYWIQRSLFPYQYGGGGLLNQLVRSLLHGWDSIKRMLFGNRKSDEFLARYAAGQQPAGSTAALPAVDGNASTKAPPSANSPRPEDGTK